MPVLETPNSADLARLIAVARGRQPADLLLVGGRVLNVYSGELRDANVAVVDGRIAYVGPSPRPAAPQTQVVELGGRVVAPGYLEPHAHPYILYNPVEFCRSVLPRGTTTVVADDLFLFQLLDSESFETLLRDLHALPLRLLWGIRLATERTLPDAGTETFPPERVRQAMRLPRVIETSEFTSWPALLAGNLDLLDGIAHVRAHGLRVDGHAAGCGYDTLAALAAAGVSACHESVSPEEVMNRVRLGLHAMLRYQSLRPDLPELLQSLRDFPLAASRVMLTTDGSSPAYYAGGYTNRLVRLALQQGLEPALAYRLATLNPASYFGLDADLGGVAPGRLADLLVLPDLATPDPDLVFVEGRLVAREGALVDELPWLDWAAYRFDGPRVSPGWRLAPDRLRPLHPGGPFPVMRLDGPAVTRRDERDLAGRAGRVVLPDGGGLLFGVLLDRKGGWLCQGVIDGFARELGGLASSYTASADVLALGRDPSDMARATELVFQQGGGIVLVERGEVCYNLPLPLGGIMTELRMPELIARVTQLERLLAEAGHPYHDPLYTLLFLSSDALPDLRLTPAGLFQVKTREILRPTEAI